MPNGTDIAYLYDGSVEGLMTCVFESFEKKEIPAAILSPDQDQFVLYDTREIMTDTEKARRVFAGTQKRLGDEAAYLIRMTFLSDREDRALIILRFLHYAFAEGPRAVSRLSHPLVGPLHQAAKTTSNEEHAFNEFLRFSEFNGVLVSVIEPKCFILPLIADHFADRFPSERFFIYDRTHRYALLYDDGRREFTWLDEFEMPEADETEQRFRALWQSFYDTIAIEGRNNPRCRMTHMPKRFWPNMTEFQREKALSEKKQAASLPDVH